MFSKLDAAGSATGEADRVRAELKTVLCCFSRFFLFFIVFFLVMRWAMPSQ